MKVNLKNSRTIRSFLLAAFFLLFISYTLPLAGCGGGGGGGGGSDPVTVDNGNTGNNGNNGNNGNSGNSGNSGENEETPYVMILSPSDGQTFQLGDMITFRCSCSASGGEILSGDALVWTSSIDGQIGTGTPLKTSSLSPGTHTITLTATDSNGKTKTASLVITISSMWEKTFNKSGDDVARSVQQTSDGGYIVAGYTGAENIYCYVIKLDHDGNKVWDKTFGKDGDGDAYSIQETFHQTSGGDSGEYIADGYIVAGSTFGAEGSDIYVVKLDEAGNVVWENTYGGSDSEEALSVQQTSDGGYVVAGYTADYDGSDFYVIKLDETGNKIWENTFGYSGYEEALSIQQTADGGYIVAGYTASDEDLYGYVVKADQDGKLVWDRTLTGNGYTSFTSIRQTPDGGYIAAGYTSGRDDYYLDCCVVKLDADGDEAWLKTFGRPDGDEEAFSIQLTSSGGYIVAGYTDSFGMGGRDFYIIKLNGDGNKVWDQTFGGRDDEEAKSIQQTSDGGYIVAGYTGGENSDFYVIKLESNGSVSTISSGN